jgi:tRNA(Arg) A34 adenosine deaminase TadA
MNNKDIRLMKDTVQLSLDHVNKGGIPFSSLVVTKDGQVLGKGVNEVNKSCDPTAHAEIVAIRQACKTVGSTNLSGATLYASGEPCALCYMAARFAGITTIVIAADRQEVASSGFDYRWTYNFFDNGQSDAGVNIQKLAPDNAIEPFETYSAMHRRRA